MKKYKKIDFDDDDLQKYSSNDLVKIADYRLRKHLLSVSDGRCFLSGRKCSTGDLQASHYIDRSNKKWRWDVRNVHLISAVSNMWDSKVFDKELYGIMSKHHFEYRIKLIETYGVNFIDELEERTFPEMITKEKLIKIIENI